MPWLGIVNPSIINHRKTWSCSFAYGLSKPIVPAILVHVEVNPSICSQKTVGLDFGRICSEAICCNSNTWTKETTIGSLFALFLVFDLLWSRGASLRALCHRKILSWEQFWKCKRCQIWLCLDGWSGGVGAWWVWWLGLISWGEYRSYNWKKILLKIGQDGIFGFCPILPDRPEKFRDWDMWIMSSL